MTVREEVRQRIDRDAQLARLRQKIGSGKATYADTAAYSTRAGKLLGEVFSRRLPEIPPEEREQLCVDLLHDRYIDINAAVDTAQRFMDEAQGFHLAPQHAPFNSARGHQIGSALRDLSKPVGTLQRRARAATETTVKSMHDERMKTEAKFRSRAGLKCYITREAVSGCCAWCSKVAGRYAYGEEPDDIYRRHDNCDCTVTFENGRQRQDVWSKREWEAPAPDAGAGEPVRLATEQARELAARHPLIRFTPEQARELEARHPLIRFTPRQAAGLQNYALTNGAGRGILNAEYDSLAWFQGTDNFTSEQTQAIESEISVIPDALLRQLSEFVSGIEIAEGRGYSSYNTETRKIILDSETASRSIVHELGHAFGAMLNLYEDPEFLRIIAKGLDLQDWGRVAIGKHPSDGSTIFYYKDSSKFIFPYQGRLYAHPDSIGRGNIDPACFREYISVGFDLYFHRPKILKTRDPDLYHYLEVLINGFTDSSNEGAN